MYDIVCVGFTCLDIPVLGDIGKDIFDIDSTHVDKISMTAGGDAVNEAVTAASLGLETAIVSYIGSDYGGKVLVEALKEKNVDVSGIEEFEGEQSQTAIPLIDKSGERHFLFNSGCSPKFTGLNVDYNKYYQTKVLNIASFFVALKFDREGVPVILRGAKERGVITVADTCCDTQGQGIESIASALEHLDYFMPSYDEAIEMTGCSEYSEIAEKLFSYGVKNVVLKLGRDGCYVRTADDEFTIAAFTDCPVIDTTGCGDNFVAGFCYGIVHELPLREAALLANAVASINAGFIGGSGGLESIEQVKDFLAAREMSISIFE